MIFARVIILFPFLNLSRMACFVSDGTETFPVLDADAVEEILSENKCYLRCNLEQFHKSDCQDIGKNLMQDLDCSFEFEDSLIISNNSVTSKTVLPICANQMLESDSVNSENSSACANESTNLSYVENQNIPVLVSSDVMSLLEKFEASEQISGAKEVKKAFNMLKKPKTSFGKPAQRSSILISPIQRNVKQTSNSHTKRSPKRKVIKEENLSDYAQQKSRIILDLFHNALIDHDYCVSYACEDNKSCSFLCLSNYFSTDQQKSRERDVEIILAKKRQFYKSDFDRMQYTDITNRERQKIIYIEKIPKFLSHEYLNSIFSKYGTILDVAIYFRKCEDNYAFITYDTNEAAANVLASYKSDPKLCRFNMCYGARRTFCKERYSDLDNVCDNFLSSAVTTDFDSLLRDAKVSTKYKNIKKQL